MSDKDKKSKPHEVDPLKATRPQGSAPRNPLKSSNSDAPEVPEAPKVPEAPQPPKAPQPPEAPQARPKNKAQTKSRESIAPTELNSPSAPPTQPSDKPSTGGEANKKKKATPATAALIPEEASDSAPSPSVGPLSGHFIDQDEDKLVGQVLADRYQIQHRIGEGGMGVVYKAEHVGLQKDVAVKVLLPELGAIEGVVKRFEREARSMSRLDHPGVVRVADFGRTHDGLLYLVMDYVDGEPLGDLIIQQGRFKPDRALHIIRQVLLALEHAHELGVVHRDLKPDNIMVLDPGGEVETTKILDFGIAKILEDSGEENKPLTVAGTVFGTPEYLSPEQAAGEPADFRADLYTVGVILYELLTGKRPFQAENRMALIGKHISAQPKPITHVLPMAELPEETDAVIMKAMAKSPDARYQNAIEFFEALGRLPVEQRPLTFWPSSSSTNVTALPPKDGGAGGKKREEKKAAASKKGETASAKKLFLGGVVVLVLAALGGGALYLSTGEGSNPKKPPKEDPLKELDKKTAKKVRTARALLNAIKPKKALQVLVPLAKKNKDEPYIQFLLGRAYLMRKAESKSLESYARAVKLNPKLKKNKRLQEDIFALLNSKYRSHRKGGLQFLDESMGKDSKPILVRAFEKLDNYQTLRSALLVAEKHGLGKAINRRRFLEIMLRDSPHCSDRREAAKQLMLSGDIEALPALKHALTRKPWVYNNRRRSNDCIRPTLQSAIARLEKQAGIPSIKDAGTKTKQKKGNGRN